MIGLDLANIVDQSEPRTRPLYIHFIFGAEGEAVHVLVNANIGNALARRLIRRRSLCV